MAMISRRLICGMAAAMLIGAALAAPASAQDATGCVGLCKELLRRDLNPSRISMAVHSVGNFVDEQRRVRDLEKETGQRFKQMGWTLSASADLFSLPAPTLGGSVAAASLKWAGDAFEDTGGRMQAVAEETYGKLVLLHLMEKADEDLLTNGRPDPEKIGRLSDNVLDYYTSPEFVSEIGSAEVTTAFFANLGVDISRAILMDVDSLTEDVDLLKDRLAVAGATVIETLDLANTIAAQSEVMTEQMEGLAREQSLTREIVAAMADANLSDSRKLALHEKGVIRIDDEKTLELVRRRATAADIIDKTGNVAKTFSGYGKVLAGLGLGEAGAAVNNMGNLVGAAGALGAAIAMQNPLGMLQGGIGVVDAFSAFSGGGESAEVRNHKAVMDELRRIQERMLEYHKKQMAAIEHVSKQVSALTETVNLRFAELGFDLALVQLDLREALADDVRACRRLAEEFAMPEVEALLDAGPAGFGRWFEADGRAAEYASCMTGLAARLTVASEIEFSGLLRVGASSDPDGLFADERRAEIRRLEQGVLQPTVGYARAYGDLSSPQTARDILYTPTFSVCDLLARTGSEGGGDGGNDDGEAPEPTLRPSVCGDDGLAGEWRVTRIAASSFNPGQGTLLSPEAALQLTDYAVTVAPWNAALIERTTGAVSRVRTESEMRSISTWTASRRTRHMMVLNSGADALDLTIAQGQLFAGVPVIATAARTLDEVIIPAYAKARLLGKTEALNALLAATPQPQDRAAPDCASPLGKGGALSSLKERQAWNTLCLMQVNPSFADNVIRAFVVLRLQRAGAAWSDWRHALRSPFSVLVQHFLGNDVILADAVKGDADRGFGAWAIELPRIEPQAMADRDKRLAEQNEKTATCWSESPVPDLTEKPAYYVSRMSSECYVFDGSLTEDFTAITYPSSQASLVARRRAIRDLIAGFCAGVGRYPAVYCPTEVRPLGPEAVPEQAPVAEMTSAR